MEAGTYKEEQATGKLGAGGADDLDLLIKASFRERWEWVFHPSDVAAPQMSSILTEALWPARL